MIKFVIFDLDGVLVEARELHYEALNRALATYGYTITREEHVSTYDALPTARKLQLLTERKGLPAELHDAIWKEKQRQTWEIVNALPADERLRDVLRRLRQDGYTIIVCSNAVRESTKLMLLRSGFMEYVDFFLSNQDIRNAKPHPEVYLTAMVKASAKPKECLVVEDSHYGRQAAVDAGAYLCPVTGVEEVTYERVIDAIRSAEHDAEHDAFVPKWQGRELTIVVPMAGEGRQFHERGYTFPKPLVEIHGKPMIQLVIENLNVEGRYVFLVRAEHAERYHLRYLLNLLAPGCEVVIVDRPTSGAAATVLLAEHAITSDHPLVIANADQYMQWNSNEFFYAMAHEECDGGIVTFPSTHPRWSFARPGADGFVAEVAEKRPISEHATAGVYYFRRGGDFLTAAKQMVAKDIRTNGEFYVCPVYNELIAMGRRIRMFPVKGMWGLGTPEDVDRFTEAFTPADLAAARLAPVRWPVAA